MDNTFLGVSHSHNPSGLMAVFADGVEVLVWRAHTAPNKRDFLGDYFIAEHPTYRTPDYWGDFSTEIVERRAHFQLLSDEEWQKYQTTALQNVMVWNVVAWLSMSMRDTRSRLFPLTNTKNLI